MIIRNLSLVRLAVLLGLLAPSLASAAPPDLGFVVTLRDDADPAAVARAHGVQPEFVYDEVLRGFSGHISDAARAGLLRDARVVRIERDAVVTIAETAASWGLDRIDQRGASLDGKYTYGQTGRGVTAYIVDTGIRPTHTQFGGRATAAYPTNGNAEDCNGHGTHVAGTIGGRDYGVAKEVTLKGVRVLDCNGSGKVSGIVAGLNWVAKNASGPSVVNMSLATGASATLDDAVESLADLGIPTAVAAANYGKDACLYSPARTPSAITVGATTRSDQRAAYSNYGACVDLFAPGSSIVSASIDSDTATTTMSGTSMASPHVAGVAALYLQANPTASASAVRDAIVGSATQGVVTNSLSAADDLLYSSVTTSSPSANVAPYADFDFSCAGSTCSFTDASSDSDGRVASWAWSFGDGAASTAQNPTHTFTAAGSYAVRLQVTDDDGAADWVEQSVSVAGAGDFDAWFSASKVKGAPRVDLGWSGASGASVDIWRDGALVATTANDGAYTDAPTGKGRASYVYEICEAGTSTCSAELAVSF